MSDWLKLDQSKLARDRAETRTERGVEIRLTLSPYDVPEAVRGYVDEQLKRFVIEFRYIQEEDWMRKEHDAHLGLRIGKNSSRLYGIEIDTAGLGASRVLLNTTVAEMVDRALDSLSEQPNGERRKGNYSVAKAVVDTESSELLRELAPTGS